MAKKSPTPKNTTKTETVQTQDSIPSEAKAETPTPAEKPAKVTPAEFDPKKLRSVGATVWNYAEDPKKVSRETFQCQRARDFGMKENDVVFVVQNGKVETLGV